MAAVTIQTGLGAHVDLRMAAGATNRWRVRVREPSGTPLDLDGWSARAQLRRSPDADLPLATLSSGPGGGATLDGDGSVTLTLPAAATEDTAWQGRRGVWDLELTDPSGEVWRAAYGAFTVEPQVTR